MSANKAIASHMMAPLVQKYLERLQEREQSINPILTHVEKGSLPDTERDELRRHAHNLAGSGATYGYPNISEAGRTLEEAVNSGAVPEMLLPLTKALLDNIHAALVVGNASRYASGQAADLPDTPKKSKEETANKKTLLVIDDDPVSNKLIAELFCDDANVVGAHDGESGILEARHCHPDLILLDVDMPGISGTAVLRRMQQDPDLQKIPVVMLTAYRRGTDVVQAMMGGAIGYVVKPFEIDSLAAKIRELFAHIDTTVLIADDDEAIRDLLYHKFRSTGVNVITASDGEEALELAQKRHPQLAIVDWMMPGLDGLALLRKIKRSEATMKTRVVMLTVKHQEQDVLDGFRHGVGDYIVKPFIAEEVVVRCLRLLGLTQTMDMDE